MIGPTALSCAADRNIPASGAIVSGSVVSSTPDVLLKPNAGLGGLAFPTPLSANEEHYV